MWNISTKELKKTSVIVAGRKLQIKLMKRNTTLIGNKRSILSRSISMSIYEYEVIAGNSSWQNYTGISQPCRKLSEYH